MKDDDDDSVRGRGRDSDSPTTTSGTSLVGRQTKTNLVPVSTEEWDGSVRVGSVFILTTFN